MFLMIRSLYCYCCYYYYLYSEILREEAQKAAKEMCVTDEMSPMVPSFQSLKTTLYKERKKASVSLVPTEPEFDMRSMSLENILPPNLSTGQATCLSVSIN